MSKRSIWRGLALGLALVLARPHTASAKGIVLITSGEAVKQVGDMPKATKEAYCDYLRKVHACHLDPAVGYTYRYWGIFWLDFWTWDGKYCTYNDRTIIEELPKDVIAKLLGVPEEELGVPFFYRLPPGLLIVGGFVGLGILAAVFKKSPVQKANVLVEDVRYQRALEIIGEELRKEEEAAKAHAAAGTEPTAPDVPSLTPFDAAVEYLVGEGIPRGEAQANLATILSTQTGTAGDAQPPKDQA